MGVLIAKRLEYEMITENNVALSDDAEHEIAPPIYAQEESKKVKNYDASTPGLCSEMGMLMVDPDYVLRHLQGFQAMFTRLLNALGHTFGPAVTEDPTP